MYEDGENSQQIKMYSSDFVAFIFRSNRQDLFQSINGDTAK